ncbi:unnamed protein product [Meganyctiphanes norvegica]|uniref:Transient receptor potential cation channel subfamily A member 1 n=1 Tax=Meganyctiphanes norvegica TaxID=48144 RepID=A0AAV2RVG0_MEGNR
MNLVHIVLTAILLSPIPNICNDHAILQKYQFICGILTLLLGWDLFMTTLNRFPSLHAFNPINTAFLISFTRILVYLGILLFAFAFIFHLLLQNHLPFTSFAQSIMKTVVWMLGDLSYDDLFIDTMKEDNITIKVLSNVVFCIFVATLGGFITNLAMSSPLESLDGIKNVPAYRNASLIIWFLRLEVKFACIRKFRCIKMLGRKDADDKYRPGVRYRLIKNMFSWITIDIKDKSTTVSEEMKKEIEYMNSMDEIKLMLQEQKEANLKLMEEVTIMKDKIRMISNA